MVKAVFIDACVDQCPTLTGARAKSPILLNAHPGLKAGAPTVRRKQRNWTLLIDAGLKQ